MAGSACPACGAAALGPPAGRLRRCGACGTAVTDPPPRGSHDAPPPRGARLAAPVLALFDAHRLRLLRRAGAGPGRGGPAGAARPRLVDAGAGRGRFVLAARRAGWAAEGLEPAARDALTTLHRTAIEAASFEALDAVVLWHVLEHVEDPHAALGRAASWLRPGGAVLVGVPNLASWQARWGGERWFHLDLPRHRTHFTPQGLRALLARAGLEVVAEHHLLLEHNPFGLWQTAVSRLTREPAYLFALLKRTSPLRPRDLAVSLAALPLAPLAVLAELAAGLARRGGTIAVTARRAG